MCPRASWCLLLVAGCGSELAEPSVFVADQGADRVLELVDGRLRVLADGLPEPSALALDGDRLLATSFRDGEVLTLDRHSGSLLGRLPPSSHRLEEPCAIAVVGDRILVLGNDSRNLLVFDRAGEDVAEVGGAVSPSIHRGHGFALLPDACVVVATSARDPGTGLLQIWNLVSHQREHHFAPYGELLDATDVTLGPDGHLWVADFGANQIVRFDTRSFERVEDGLTVAGPISLAFDRPGRLYVLQRERLVRFDDLDSEPETLLDGLSWGRGLLVID